MHAAFCRVMGSLWLCAILCHINIGPLQSGRSCTQSCCSQSWTCCYRVVAGQWLGPWVLCKALAAAVAAGPDLGLTVHVVADPGGGAPALLAHRCAAWMLDWAVRFLAPAGWSMRKASLCVQLPAWVCAVSHLSGKLVCCA
jgi:hypothetical protein